MKQNERLNMNIENFETGYISSACSVCSCKQ